MWVLIVLVSMTGLALVLGRRAPSTEDEVLDEVNRYMARRRRR